MCDFGDKGAIFVENMRAFQVKSGILKGKMCDLCFNVLFLKGKCVILGLNGGLLKRKRAIFGLNSNF